MSGNTLDGTVIGPRISSVCASISIMSASTYGISSRIVRRKGHATHAVCVEIVLIVLHNPKISADCVSQSMSYFVKKGRIQMLLLDIVSMPCPDCRLICDCHPLLPRTRDIVNQSDPAL